jgi:hypothetical protein
MWPQSTPSRATVFNPCFIEKVGFELALFDASVLFVEQVRNAETASRMREEAGPKSKGRSVNTLH